MRELPFYDEFGVFAGQADLAAKAAFGRQNPNLILDRLPRRFLHLMHVSMRRGCNEWCRSGFRREDAGGSGCWAFSSR